MTPSDPTVWHRWPDAYIPIARSLRKEGRVLLIVSGWCGSCQQCGRGTENGKVPVRPGRTKQLGKVLVAVRSVADHVSLTARWLGKARLAPSASHAMSLFFAFRRLWRATSSYQIGLSQWVVIILRQACDELPTAVLVERDFAVALLDSLRSIQRRHHYLDATDWRFLIGAVDISVPPSLQYLLLPYANQDSGIGLLRPAPQHQDACRTQIR